MMDSNATLRELESMIIGVGGESPAPSMAHHASGRTSSTHPGPSRHAGPKAIAPGAKDCLATDANQPVTFNRRSQIRSVTATPSMMKGASMAGRDRADKRYIGQGFQPPPAESPGPIYSPPAGFAEEATIAGSGFSFSRAPRQRREGQASTPGPNAYPVHSTIGAQPTSTTPSPSAAVFTRATRFNDKIFLSAAHSKGMHATDAPGPAAYFADVSTIPVPGRRAPSALLLSSKESDKKTFISKAHVVDAVGAATVNCEFPSANALDGGTAKSPAFSFGTGTRGTGPVQSIHVTTIDDDANRSTSSRKRTVVRPPAEPTPGPGHYGLPSDQGVLPCAPKAVIPQAPRNDKRFWNKMLTTHQGADSPGMLYEPKYDVIEPHHAAAHFAGSKTEGNKAERFNDKLFIGKAFKGGLGAASPGPAYAVVDTETGPAFSIAHKERHFPKTVFPGPSRPRWISRESAKDNMGAYSPGPKYNTASDFAKQGLAYSFGHAQRRTTDDVGTSTANQGATPPTDAPAGPVYPLHPPGVKIAPPSTTMRRVSPVDEAMQQRAAAAPLIAPKFDVTEGKAPAFSFSAAGRFAGGNAVHVTASPGPVYTPQHRLVEQRVPGGAFGGLP